MRIIIFALFICCNLFGFSQVDIQTGSSKVDIPLFKHTDSKVGIEIPIVISYFSNNGIKTDERPGEVGQSWNINAGGFVQRIQKGEPDDQFRTKVFIGLDPDKMIYERDNPDAFNNYYGNGYIFSDFPVEEIAKTKAYSPRFTNDGLSYNYIGSPRELVDREQDLFIAQANGLNVSFVIGNNQIPKLLDNSKSKIEFFYFANLEMEEAKLRTRIKSFKITNEFGVMYYFDRYETIELSSVKLKYSENATSYQPISMHVIEDEFVDRFKINKWVLSKIQNPCNLKEILFNYASNSNTVIGETQLLLSTTDNVSKAVTVVETKSKEKELLLSKIDFSDGFKFIFKYDTRDDNIENNEDIKLAEIIYSNAEVIGSIKLNYNYFLNNLPVNSASSNLAFSVANPENKMLARLCLIGVNIKDKNGATT